MDEEKYKKGKYINVPSVEIKGRPITVGEINKDIKKRLSRVNDELSRGFNFIRDHYKSVTFFGSARFEEDSPYYQKAKSLANKIADIGYDVITGGGPGIMEAANRGAYESSKKGHSVGFNIELPREQVLNPYTDNNISFFYFFTRKVALTFSAEAYVFFPGGYGTLDEFFEIVTLVQTEKIPKVPIILVGNEFWGRIEGLLREVLLNEYKTLSPEDLDLFVITEDEDEIMKIIEKAPLRKE